MEALPVIAGLIALMIPLAISLVLRAWGKRIAVRRGNTPGWRAATWVPIAALVVAVTGLAFTFAGLIATFKALGGVAADQKQQVLAAGIAEAMKISSVTGPIASLLYFGSAILFAVGSSMPPIKPARVIDEAR